MIILLIILILFFHDYFIDYINFIKCFTNNINFIFL
jgi:hypothetical protein